VQQMFFLAKCSKVFARSSQFVLLILGGLCVELSAADVFSRKVREVFYAKLAKGFKKKKNSQPAFLAVFA
jgi:hypothetical protein